MIVAHPAEFIFIFTATEARFAELFTPAVAKRCCADRRVSPWDWAKASRRHPRSRWERRPARPRESEAAEVPPSSPGMVDSAWQVHVNGDVTGEHTMPVTLTRAEAARLVYLERGRALMMLCARLRYEECAVKGSRPCGACDCVACCYMYRIPTDRDSWK